ncbi:hypothetical protein Tco_1040341, partial [Tanacetum coccineum]
MECSSCGALYNKSCGCSKGGLVDKFVRDPNKTPDSSQRPPILCAKCGNPVEGPSCQGCALWRKKLKEVWFTTCHENGINQDLLNTSESSNERYNVVMHPRERKKKSELKKSKRLKIDIGRIPVCYDEDDEESSIPLKDIIIARLPPYVAITLVLFTKEPVDSLIMADEHLDTIPETKSDELIKSSVEDLGDTLFLESLLYDNSSPRPPEEFNSENPTESFSPSPIPVEDSDSLMEEIDIFLDGDTQYTGYGYCKNHKKTVKAGQTRTRERKDCTRAGRLQEK